MVSLLVSGSLSNRYTENMPQVADPEVGRTFPLNVHGCIVYLTRRESFYMDALDCVSFGAVILCLALGLYGFSTGKLSTGKVETNDIDLDRKGPEKVRKKTPWWEKK